MSASKLVLLPLDVDLTSFYASFSVHDREFSFSFYNLPPSKANAPVSLKDVKIKCDAETQQLLMGFDTVLQQRLWVCQGLPAFILELRNILESIGFAYPRPSLHITDLYQRVCQEIDLMGRRDLISVGSDLTELKFRIFDIGGRRHIVEIALAIGYPTSPPDVLADLPFVVELKWNEGSTIKTILDQYKEAISLCQDFWTIMDDLDKRFCVMEPEHPSRSNTFRHVTLGSDSSLSLVVDPLAPRSMPEFRFFGSDLTVAPLRKKVNRNAHKWNRSKLLTENLSEVLGMVFPSPEAKEPEDTNSSCGICYAVYLPGNDAAGNSFVEEGDVPDRACDNSNCGRKFHTDCLGEWMRSISTTRQSFNMLFGDCPYCSHPMAVKLSFT